jgi:hypothetical protein
VASGLATLVEAAVLFLSPLWLILLAVFPRAVVRGSGAAAGAASPPAAAVAALDARRLLEHFFLAALAIIVLGILAADVTSFKSRWMHPGLILFPLYFFCRVEKAGFDAGHVRRYSLALVAVVALVIAFRVAQASVGPPLCDRCRLWMPYPELAEQIADAGFTRGTIVAADEHIAGNFRVRFPDSRVVSVGYDFYVPPPDEAGAREPGQCLILWNAGSGATVPGTIAAFLGSQLGVPLTGEERVNLVAAEPHFRDGRILRLGYVLTDGVGTCR